MKILAGAFRMFTAVAVVVVGLVPTLLLSLVPVRIRGARLASWFVMWLARVVSTAFRVHITCTHPDAYASHHGLILTNHSSFLDVLVLLHLTPVRFLAAAEVRRFPALGRMAASVETVFVDRKNKHSRRAARQSISKVLQRDPFPPIALFPEGRLGPGYWLMPFRHGAFELAVDNCVPYMLCGLHYDRPEITTWYGGNNVETLFGAIWRVATCGTALHAELRVLSVWRPGPGDDAALLAKLAQRTVEQGLGMPAAPLDIADSPPALWQ